ncbi:sialin-like isoform X1 [Daktulosphaira vitifoliae]|uniref:sialin-like isoform X1 n=1 Tax=Daktulosphaira vitifoliae TaxID=58002 RepID=UPI0021AA73BE|nr:sialin-like isoform X1 [Daktulosphaira vitifoliae]
MEKRTLLWYMTFWGFALNYIFRMNINIAIVSMIKHPVKTSNVTLISECFQLNTIIKSNNNSSQIILSTKNNDDDKFEWDEYQQNIVLAAFFMLHMIMPIPGGMLSQRYGGKTIFGLSNGLAAILSFAIPPSAKISYKALTGVRLVQGFIAGSTWPAMHTMTAKWIPKHERSRFVSAYLGSSVGTAVTYMTCGYLIDLYNWQIVFYLTGAIGLLWYICWIFFVYESPAEHPTITEKERLYIESSIGKTLKNSKSLSIPWKSLLLSKPLLINVLTQNGGIWGLFTISTQAPTYFNFVLGLNIKETGVWSGLPYISRWIFAFGFGIFCDHLIKSKTMSVTNVRKLSTFFCNFLQGLFILGISFCGCNTIASIIMVALAATVNGCVASGALAGAVDLAPNYAAIIQGLVGTFSVLAGLISPMIVGFFTYHQQTLGQWSKVFYLSSAICCSTGLLYIFFANSEVQKWNNKYDSVDIEKEMVLIKRKSDNNNKNNS